MRDYSFALYNRDLLRKWILTLSLKNQGKTFMYKSYTSKF